MSRSIERTDLLDAPDFPRQSSCAVCGMPSSNRHHVVPKGMGGTSLAEGPRVPLCGSGNTSGCHRLAHGLGLSFRHDGLGWSYFASDDATADINKRRKRSSLPRIHAGLHPCIVEPDWDAVDEYAAPTTTDAPCSVTLTMGDTLAGIQRRIEEAATLEGTLAYAVGVSLTEARRCFAEAYPGKRDASQAYMAWVVDTLRLDKSTVSKREAFATLPESAADLGPTRGYLAARAVKCGLATAQEAVEMARALSASDFRATYWPREERPECRIVCPLSGADCKSPSVATKGESA